jgi:hypothetical protein
MSLYSISLVLGILANQALAGCIPSKEKACPAPANPWLNKCPKGIPKTWACLDPKIKFPTVDCIVADLKTCGTLDANPVLLYSFSATTVEVRTKVRDVLNPRPVMFNDALPDDWHNKIKVVKRFGLQQGKIADPNVNKRNDAFVNRFSAALTKAAKGEVILVTKNRNSDFGGSGAYSMPNPKTAKENVWRTYEFPLAQRNPAVTRVVTYALTENSLNKVVDFEPQGKKGAVLPKPKFPDPPLPKVNATPGPSKPVPGPSKPAPAPSKPKTSKKPSRKTSKKPSRKTSKKPSRKTRAVRSQEALNARN